MRRRPRHLDQRSWRVGGALRRFLAEHHAIFAIHFVEVDFHNLGLGSLHIERVTRAGECLLTRLRDGQLSRTAEVSGRVAALAGAVRQMLGEIESTGHDGENDYPDLLAELNRLASAASAGAR